LIALQQVDPVWWTEGGWWGEEQMNVIVECLEDKDETLKKKVGNIWLAICILSKKFMMG